MKFDLLHCAIMVCVSDQNCMRLCRENNFPCYDFNFAAANPNLPAEDASPSVMEQIAYLKLFHIPKALMKGVNVVLLDLDVASSATPSAGSKRDRRVRAEGRYLHHEPHEGRMEAGWTEPCLTWAVPGERQRAQLQDVCAGLAGLHAQHQEGHQGQLVKTRTKWRTVWVSEHRDGFRWKYIPSSQVVLITSISSSLTCRWS